MGKLLTAVVHHADTEPIVEGLRSAGYRFTMVPSIGGFLGEPNTTFILAVDDDEVDEVVAVFERRAHAREVEVPLVLLERLSDWEARTVSHGGAMIVVSEVSRIVRL